MGGPWMPDEVVMGMRVEVKIGLETSLSTPAERRWMNLRLVGGEGGVRLVMVFWSRRNSGWHVELFAAALTWAHRRDRVEAFQG